MVRQSSFRLPFHGHIIRLSGTVLAEDVERELYRYYRRRTRREMLFDMSDVEYIDVAALMIIAATFTARLPVPYPTSITLPRSRKVRDFLRVWRFPEILVQLTNKLLDDVFSESDISSLQEPQETYAGIGDGVAALEYNPDWEGDHRTRRNFFEFAMFQESAGAVIRPSGGMAAAPRTESQRWTTALIRQVLETHLRGGTAKDEVARVIVFEALSNAVRHPAASKIVVVSKLERSSAGNQLQDRYLRLCVWDDGASIAKTLSEPLAAGLPVRQVRLEPWQTDRIFVQVQTFEERKIQEVVIDQSEEPTPGSSEARLLLSSLFPGVSRSVAVPVANVQPFREDDESPWSYSSPGMGLYALSRTVLDQFQGDLVIRSGAYRLSMQVAHDAYRVKYQARYKCKITEYPKWYSRFIGNLLVIHLPLARE